jgi:hypothetical protein
MVLRGINPMNGRQLAVSWLGQAINSWLFSLKVARTATLADTATLTLSFAFSLYSCIRLHNGFLITKIEAVDGL